MPKRRTFMEQVIDNLPPVITHDLVDVLITPENIDVLRARSSHPLRLRVGETVSEIVPRPFVAFR